MIFIWRHMRWAPHDMAMVSKKQNESEEACSVLIYIGKAYVIQRGGGKRQTQNHKNDTRTGECYTKQHRKQTMNIDAHIEALLFFRGEPTTITKIAELLEKTEDEIKAGLDILETKLHERGVALMRKGDEVMLATAPFASALIEKITKEELTRDLGKAGLETLSIILYRGPISRREIDYIRGVNSNFIVRNLLVRGLVEKIQGSDARSFEYQPTFELLSFLGVTDVKSLPEYEKVQEEIKKFNAAQEKPPESSTEKQESTGTQPEEIADIAS